MEVLEPVAGAGEAGGLDTSVVRPCGRGKAVVVNVFAESVDCDLSGDAEVCVQGKQTSGAVIKPVDHLNISPVSEAPVGEI